MPAAEAVIAIGRSHCDMKRTRMQPAGIWPLVSSGCFWMSLIFGTFICFGAFIGFVALGGLIGL